MNINCQPPLQFVYFSTDTHIPWISHNTLRDRLFKNGVAIRKKVYSYNELIISLSLGFYLIHPDELQLKLSSFLNLHHDSECLRF